MPPAQRFYRLLLATYPAAFRRTQGEELQLLFEDMSRDHGGRRVAFWLRIGRDWMASVATEWADHPGMRHLAVAGAATLAILISVADVTLVTFSTVRLMIAVGCLYGFFTRRIVITTAL